MLEVKDNANLSNVISILRAVMDWTVLVIKSITLATQYGAGL